MTSGCPKLPFCLFPLLIVLNFLSPRAECYITLSLSNRNNDSTDKLTYLLRNPIRFITNSITTSTSATSNSTSFITNAITASTTAATYRNPVKFIAHTTTIPLSTPRSDFGTECFRINNVTHSSITIKSNKPSTLNLEKCTGSHTSSQELLSVGTHILQNLEACTSYYLRVDQNCSTFVKTPYKAPEAVANVGASLSKGILNLTWHSNISTANCISHYEIKFIQNANCTTDYKSPVVAQYYEVSVLKVNSSYFSVTTVDITGQKTTSDVFQVIVRDSFAVVKSRSVSLTGYSQSSQPLHQQYNNCLPTKSKRVADARNRTRAFDPCLFTSREYLWIGSQSVTFRVNFSCPAFKCSVDCCLRRRGTSKCESIPSEEWSSLCSSRESGETTVVVTGGKLNRNEVYICSVEVSGRYQTYRQQSSFSTRDGRPVSPGRVWATNINSTSFLISWDLSPNVDKEPVDYYILTVAAEQPNYRHGPLCRYPLNKQTFNTTTVTPQAVTGLLPYFVYKVYVDAYNTFGSTQSKTEKYCTQPSDPGNCENVGVTKPAGDIVMVNPVYIIKWSEPCYWNAHPRDTVIRIVGKRPDNPNKTTVYEDHFNNFYNTFNFTATRDFVYSVEIIARVEKAPTKRCAGPLAIDVGIGLSSVSSKWLKVRPEVLTPNDGGLPLVAIPLHQNLLDDTNGTIKHIAIMVAQKGFQGPRERVLQKLPSWPNARSWYEAMTEDRVLLYQATPKLWSIPLYVARRLDRSELTFFGGVIATVEDNAIHDYNLGSDNCFTNETYRRRRPTDDEVDDQGYVRGANIAPTSPNATGSEATEVVYCNGPLRRNVEYVVRLRVFTSVGYTDSEDIYFRTGNTPLGWTPFYEQLWFYGIVPVFLVSVLLSTLWIRKQRRWTNSIASAPSPDMIESGGKRNRLPRSRRRSISPQKLPVVAARLLANKCTLEKEFEDLNEISAEWAVKVPCTVGLMKENRLKNRYADVVPYDYNRVKLSSESTSQTDYINASFVKGFSMDTEYIACQGPTVETSNDFWQMVFDQKVCFIVMLTSLVENGMAKCSQYFSELCENKEWMDFTVKCSSRLDLSNYTVRELQLYKRTNSEKRFIQHFQFRDWPDFGCPRDIDGILEFCDVLRGNLCLRGDSNTVVHCSAGIGRTGTLIALDILLQFVHYNRKMDIMRTVLRLREQRQWMVRTADQYAFLYRCLKTAAERHFSPES